MNDLFTLVILICTNFNMNYISNLFSSLRQHIFQKLLAVNVINGMKNLAFRSQGQEEGLPAAIHPGAEAEGGGIGAADTGRHRDARPQGARRRQDRARALGPDRPAEAALRPAQHQDCRGRRAPHILARNSPLPQTCPRPPVRRPSALNPENSKKLKMPK
jgi:hypothetical protein